MTATRIALVGAGGKMGQAILSEMKSQGLDSNAQLVSPLHALKTPADLDPGCVDVVIEFAVPAATVAWANWCAAQQIPFVSGTTGLTQQEASQVRQAAQKTAVLWSSNMSPTVHVLADILEKYGKTLSEFDVEIEEVHHRHKKDKPSGTANLLQNALQTSYPRKLNDPVSLRGGEVFGIHRIFFLGKGETLTFEHQAGSREIFARGALQAALWIKGRKPGWYTLMDVLRSR